MPTWRWGEEDRRGWPVKTFHGQFSETKKLALECRYARRRIRAVFA